ncbi:hypothetical protein CA262_24235 [Sphingobium sp. GW456-12-10-14-TSB1]|nr:hypothetical protein CA262_24235 [Sphingobium sp. GW456-12-10-14-TSB1]
MSSGDHEKSLTCTHQIKKKTAHDETCAAAAIGLDKSGVKTYREDEAVKTWMRFTSIDRIKCSVSAIMLIYFYCAAVDGSNVISHPNDLRGKPIKVRLNMNVGIGQDNKFLSSILFERCGQAQIDDVVE